MARKRVSRQGPPLRLGLWDVSRAHLLLVPSRARVVCRRTRAAVPKGAAAAASWGDRGAPVPEGAAVAAPQELQYLHRVVMAVPESGQMEIEADQLGLEAGFGGKDLPSVKQTATELSQVAVSAAMIPDRVRKYRSL
eukprot:469065-Amphidinium_carterae.1